MSVTSLQAPELLLSRIADWHAGQPGVWHHDVAQVLRAAQLVIDAATTYSRIEYGHPTEAEAGLDICRMLGILESRQEQSGAGVIG